LPQLVDPVDVELTVSDSVATTAVDENFWAGLVAHAAAVPSRRSNALLRAMAALLPGRPGEWAMDAVVSPLEPPWGSRIGRLAFGECWIGDRSVDAGYLTLVCCYSYGDEEHAMVFLLDEMKGGVVQNAFVTRDPAEARTRLADHAPLGPITAEAAHWLLEKSYARLDKRPGLDVEPDVHRTRLLARRRIALALS
jgi:hypothetical protein